MREVIQISVPQEPAFFKANPFGPDIKETPYWALKWWLLEDEDDEVQKAMTRSLNKARKIHEEYLAQEVQDVDAQEPSSNHGFGRDFASGRGQFVPSLWKLLGGSRSMVGSGKTTRRNNAGPTSKAKGYCCGKLIYLFFTKLLIFTKFSLYCS